MKFKEAIEQTRREYLRELMVICKGDIKHAVELSGIYRTHLYKLLKKYGLSELYVQPVHRGNWNSLQ